MAKNDIYISKNELIDRTMLLVGNYFVREAQDLCNEKSGNGNLEIIFAMKQNPRLNHSYNVKPEIRNGSLHISHPTKEYNEKLLRLNNEIVYSIVSNYISSKAIVQGTITFIFEKGKIIDCKFSSSFIYRDLERFGKEAFDLEIDIPEEEDLV